MTGKDNVPVERRDPDGSTDLREILQVLSKGINTIMMTAGVCLCAALFFVVATRDRVTVQYPVTLSAVPPWVWLQCGEDNRCRSAALGQWFMDRAPEGVMVKTMQEKTVITLQGRKGEEAKQNASVAAFVRRVESDWRAEALAWKQAAGQACHEAGTGTETCAGILLMTARTEGGHVLWTGTVSETRQYRPGIVIILSVLAGLMAGCGGVLLSDWRQRVYEE